MNFLEIINECLLELNYKQVESFSDLIKNDHKKIIHIMNITNKEVCLSDSWNFLLKKQTLTLEQGSSEINNTINGRILYVIIDGEKYEFCANMEPFLFSQPTSNIYTEFNNKLLFPKFSQNKEIEVIYYSKNCVIDNQGNEKENLETSTDETLLPMPFGAQILIYGTCLRFKANPQHVKFAYWMSRYKDALQNLRSKTCVSVSDFPQVKMHRI